MESNVKLISVLKKPKVCFFYVREALLEQYVLELDHCLKIL